MNTALICILIIFAVISGFFSGFFYAKKPTEKQLSKNQHRKQLTAALKEKSKQLTEVEQEIDNITSSREDTPMSPLKMLTRRNELDHERNEILQKLFRLEKP